MHMTSPITSTSAKYSTPGEFTGTRLMAINNVALGDVKNIYEKRLDLERAPDGFNSVHGVSKTDQVQSFFTVRSQIIHVWGAWDYSFREGGGAEYLWHLLPTSPMVARKRCNGARKICFLVGISYVESSGYDILLTSTEGKNETLKKKIDPILPEFHLTFMLGA